MLTHLHSVAKHPARVIVIGGSGVIGKALLARLTATSIPVIAPNSRELDLLGPDATERLAAILRPGDAVVMLAALTPDRGRDNATFMKNLSMAEAVCAALAKVPSAQVVYLSSDAVYPFGQGVINEETPAVPFDLYGIMHRAREVMFAQQVAEAVPLAVLRCTLVASAADTHNSYGPNRFLKEARAKGTITLGGEGEETRDHVLVEDVAAVIERVLIHRSRGLLNIASGSSVSYRELAGLVAAGFSSRPQIKTTPRTNSVTHRHFDVAATRRAFPDFRFTKLSIGLDRIYRAASGVD